MLKFYNEDLLKRKSDVSMKTKKHSRTQAISSHRGTRHLHKSRKKKLAFVLLIECETPPIFNKFKK